MTAKAMMRYGSIAVAGCAGLLAWAPQAAMTQTPENNVRKAIPWKQLAYTCESGKKLTAYLRGDVAKISFEDKTYLMKQTMSADGNRYSDGKVVWWGKGNGGFLQEDTPDGNGAMIVKGCKLDRPLNGVAQEGSITGAVTYLQRMALPPNAVIQVQLLDTSLADAPARVIAEDNITLGDRQLPVPYTLKFDAAKIDPQHRYSVSAKITVDGTPRFISDQAHPALTSGTSSHVDLALKPVAGK
jgi:putative lipoprotein